MIVDDNKACLNQLEHYVKSLYPQSEVTRFENPQRAADYSVTHPVDSLFTEIDMKPLDGLSLARQLRSRYPRLAVYFVTHTNEYAVDAFGLHADGYYLKPVLGDRKRA